MNTTATALDFPEPTIDWLGTGQPYEPVWSRMRAFCRERRPETPDAFWLLEHAPVFTQGTNGRAQHLLTPGDIPVVQSDRGGQVTYHGPGQLMTYVMVDLRRRGLGVRSLVRAIEAAMVDTLAEFGIEAHARDGAPGVYVGDAKIGSIGLRVRNGLSYHGLALNVAMDLEPFSRIDPCGFRGLAMTQVADLGGPSDTRIVGEALLPYLCSRLDLIPARPPRLTP